MAPMLWVAMVSMAAWSAAAAPPPLGGLRPGNTAKEMPRDGLETRLDSTRPKRVEIVVERSRGGRAERMDPNHVFDSGDLVRFRFRASFNGYLYVMNHATSGQFVLLFPKEETGTLNRIEAGREYLVPMTERGWFRLEGPPGHEVVYWLVSPVRLSDGASALSIPRLPAPAPGLNPSITPRCDDAIFRARGECLDNSAGLKALGKDSVLPENLAGYAGAAGRELTFVKSNKAAAVTVEDDSEEPFLYTMRLAHR